jgi:hypothetical protein
VKSDWDAWNARSLAEEPIVRLILDGTVVRVRLDRKATAISLLVVIGVRADGQKVLLAIKSMGSESTEAWRAVLDDLIRRGLRRPEFLIVDGAPGLEAAIAAVWDGVPVQRCTVPQASQPPGARARATARRNLCRLQRHDLRGDARGSRGSPQDLHSQMAAQAPRRRSAGWYGRRLPVYASSLGMWITLFSARFFWHSVPSPFLAQPRGTGGDMSQLILKRAPIGHNQEDYDVLESGVAVGRIFLSLATLRTVISAWGRETRKDFWRNKC